MRRHHERLRERRRPRRRGPVERVGGPHQQLLGVVGDVEEAARALGIGEMRQREVEHLGGGFEPALLAPHLVQREQTGGQRGVVLEDRRTVAHHAAQAGPPQPAVDDVQVEQGRGTT